MAQEEVIFYFLFVIFYLLFGSDFKSQISNLR